MPEHQHINLRDTIIRLTRFSTWANNFSLALGTAQELGKH